MFWRGQQQTNLRVAGCCRAARLLMLASHYQAKNSYSMGVYVAGRALLEAQFAKREMRVGKVLFMYVYIHNPFWMIETYQHRRQEPFCGARKTYMKPSTFVKYMIKFVGTANPITNFKFAEEYVKDNKRNKYFIFIFLAYPSPKLG